MTENAQNKQTHKKTQKTVIQKTELKQNKHQQQQQTKKTTKHTDTKQKKHIIISIIKPTFSWQHIDVQLLVKKSILCCLRKSSGWQSLGSYQFSRDVAFV